MTMQYPVTESTINQMLKPNMKIKFVENCYPAFLKLSLMGCLKEHTKLKLLWMCSHLLYRVTEPVMVNLLPNISETLYKIPEALESFGDYLLQSYATEVLFRFSAISPELRENIATRLKQHRDNFLELTLQDFYVNCRIFLNDINSSRSDMKNVMTIACYKAFIGHQQILKPKMQTYEELWIDFNFGTRNISFICDAESLSLKENCQNDIAFITVNRKSIMSYDFQRVTAPDSVVKDRYYLKLKLLECDLCEELKSVKVETKNKYLIFLFKASSIPSFMDVFILPEFFCSQINPSYIKEKSTQTARVKMPRMYSGLRTSDKLYPSMNEVHMLSIQQKPLSDLSNNENSGIFQRATSLNNSKRIQRSSTLNSSLNPDENLAKYVKSGYCHNKWRPNELSWNNLNTRESTFERLLHQPIQENEHYEQQ